MRVIVSCWNNIDLSARRAYKCRAVASRVASKGESRRTRPSCRLSLSLSLLLLRRSCYLWSQMEFARVARRIEFYAASSLRGSPARVRPRVPVRSSELSGAKVLRD